MGRVAVKLVFHSILPFNQGPYSSSGLVLECRNGLTATRVRFAMVGVASSVRPILDGLMVVVGRSGANWQVWYIHKYFYLPARPLYSVVLGDIRDWPGAGCLDVFVNLSIAGCAWGNG